MNPIIDLNSIYDAIERSRPRTGPGAVSDFDFGDRVPSGYRAALFAVPATVPAIGTCDHHPGIVPAEIDGE